MLKPSYAEEGMIIRAEKPEDQTEGAISGAFSLFLNH